MNEIFQNPHEIEDFLMQNGLDETLANEFMNEATLNLAQLFLDSSNIVLKPIACDPEKLRTYLQSDDIKAIESLSKSLCDLDSKQVRFSFNFYY